MYLCIIMYLCMCVMCARACHVCTSACIIYMSVYACMYQIEYSFLLLFLINDFYLSYFCIVHMCLRTLYFIALKPCVYSGQGVCMSPAFLWVHMYMHI